MDYVWSIFGLSSSDMMSRDEMRERLQMPYLKALQALPGNTRSEKQKWLMKLANRQQDSGDVEQLPAELQPLLQLEIAIKQKRHEDIASALKAEDMVLISKAFKATWFFDGSHKDIINVAYFSELFRYVSMNTRVKIVKTLSYRLTDNDETKFAVELFEMIESTFGVQQASPLIVACDKEFIFSTLTLGKFVPSCRIIMKIFNKHPDVIIRLLSNQHFKTDEYTNRCRNIININTYKLLLPRILKQQPAVFAELYETHDEISLSYFSNTCIDVLLKKCKQQVIRNPLRYVDLIPPAKISSELMERIILDLLPSDIVIYNTQRMLHYMSHYPQEKKYELLSKSYRNKYGIDLLCNNANITPDLMTLLPDVERIKQARILLRIWPDHHYKNIYDCEYKWFCYLPTEETIPSLKKKISMATQQTDRICYIRQMIFSCKVNKDSNALLSTLKYFLQRHKNEQVHVFQAIMNLICSTYKIVELNAEHASVLYDILNTVYVRHGFTSEATVEILLHFYLVHDMMDKVTRLIDMLLDINNGGYSAKFDLLNEHPQYERMCLEVYVKQMQERYPPSSWQRDEEEEPRMEEKEDAKRKEQVRMTLCRFVLAMHDSNDRCKQLILEKKLKPMMLDDYSWLKDAISTILRYKDDFGYITRNLYEKEKELYDSIFPRTSNKANVKTNAVLSLLKRNPQSILDEWEYYLTECKNNCEDANVHRFIKNIRWYKDIPIKFTESCVDDLQRKNKDVKPLLVILAFLLHGDPLIKVIDPFVPTTTTVDIKYLDAKDNYKVVKNLLWSVKFSNPPIPLDFLFKLCEGDYLQLALMPMINLSRRSSLPKVMAFAQKMAEMRVSVRKHGIRLVNIIASKQELNEFVKRMWSSETNCSIREVLFDTIRDFFLKEPSETTWSMLSTTMLTLLPSDEGIVTQVKLYPDIPESYMIRYLEVWLSMITTLEEKELEERTVIITCMNRYLESLKLIHDIVPEKLATRILQEFLFNEYRMSIGIANAVSDFTIQYLLTNDVNKIAKCIKVLGDVFTDRVATNWKETWSERLYFYPTGKMMYYFLKNFAIEYGKKTYSTSYSSPIIDHVLAIYTSTLSPTTNANAYLLLYYAKMLEKDPRNFGLKLGQHVPELIAIFSPQFLPFMGTVLVFFVREIFSAKSKKNDYGKSFSNEDSSEDKKVNVAMGLIEADNMDCWFMAAILTSSIRQDSCKNVSQYFTLTDKLQQADNPAITSILNALRCQSILSSNIFF
ncbi:uncharacterized protein LOC113561669 [Ooceraea biroi]|uniref:uncharacterized protein LOC113561669 n=1 Tax=Ooceraea biroi TaxID=2015173 RepID=UPI000F0865E0|nr:uncharacterized protein LOC113561669 [Ooceraea biroi]